MGQRLPIALAVVTVVVGCKPTQGNDAATSSSAKGERVAKPVQASSLPATSASASASSPAPTARPPAARCKAPAGAKKPDILATRREISRQSILEHGTLIFSTFGTRSGEIVSVNVDGSGLSVLAPLTAMPTGLAANATHVYFTQDNALFRIPRAGGTPERFAEGFSGALALDATYVWGIAFDPASKMDGVVRVALAGGAPEMVHQRKREKTKDAFPLSGFGAMAASGTEILVADAGFRSVLAIDPGTRAARTLREAPEYAYPSALAFFAGLPSGPQKGWLERSAEAAGGRYVVLSEAGGGAIYGVTPDGVFLADLGYMAPVASIRAFLPKVPEPIEVARIRPEVAEITGDADCVYVSSSEQLQSVWMAFALPQAARP